jgi:outer membrane protein assembly factor BamA
MTFDGDFRHYLHISDYFNIAFRATAGASFGPNPQKFFLGGTTNWFNPSFSNNELPFDEPEDFAFMEFIMPLRGYSINEISGSKYFLSNLELRLPLFGALFAGPLPLLFSYMQGALFLDIGGAFDNKFIAMVNIDGVNYSKNLLMSSGIGLRSYILGLPFKVDIAWRNEFHGWSPPYYLFSLGLDF